MKLPRPLLCLPSSPRPPPPPLLLLLLLALLVLPLPPSVSAYKPTDRCGGSKMYYTPLLSSDTRGEFGVCDSSCHPIVVPPRTAPAPHRSTTKAKRGHLRRLDTASPTTTTTTTAVSRCDTTKTLPEDDLDPEQYGDKFPFHMRTCWIRSGAARDDLKAAQRWFEQACQEAQGIFTNPFFKTWLDDGKKP
ncbi:uncharacterized protein PFL1_03216 [Pseudozyma flocculosa PF-1]|uniref:Uncharacterized protein n=1 Tax=Pseudozyma flocculosa PF-1 TaxID=1277687 RepID=A0A061HFR8_9BASI|nr:uncharacterized protein PFL1_03216 [Pseudozyma flocculosa PF-1]EPQ29461.1 hypothetical protein PFL1_03216 [Pseudozyma flocculosa PF-1]